jgi:OOP family OmpA-OmpF porin
MTRKITAITLFLTVLLLRAGAQGFSVELSGGMQGTRYTLQNGTTSLQPGGSLGLGYTFRLANNVDLLTGVTGGIYRTKATQQDGLSFSSYQVDDAGSAFQYNVKATGYQEMQRFFAASVPLLLQYHTTGSDIQWYINGGGKVFLPFANSVALSAKQLVLSGYYPDYNIEVANLPQHGFGTVNNWKGNATPKLKPSAAASMATGFSFLVAPGMRLYAGLFVDYGLTDMKDKKDDQPLAPYSPAGVTKVKAGSLLNTPAAGTVNLLAFGIQLRLGFGSATPRVRPEREKKSKKEPEAQPKRDSIGDDERDLIASNVVFGRLSDSTLPETQKERLDEIADVLKQYPKVHVTLTGHVCNSDADTEDSTIGVGRANAVARYLVSKGVEAARLEVNPTAERDEPLPFDPFANFQARRVVIRVK